MNQSTTSFEPVIQSVGADDPVHQVIARLSPLPSVIRYYDPVPPMNSCDYLYPRLVMSGFENAYHTSDFQKRPRPTRQR
jgi:hypothetical protein